MSGDLFFARPRAPRWVALGFSVVLVLGSLVGFFALEPTIRARFTAFQLVTLVVFVAVMVVMMCAIGYGYVAVQPTGLRFRNGLRTHRLPFEAVDGFRFEPGDPWPRLLVSSEFATNHEVYQLMGIQGSDGAYAQRQYQELVDAVEQGRGRPF